MAYLFGAGLFFDGFNRLTGVLVILVAVNIQLNQTELVLTSHAPEPVLIGQIDDSGSARIQKLFSRRPIRWSWSTVEQLVCDYKRITDRWRGPVSEQTVDGLA